MSLYPLSLVKVSAKAQNRPDTIPLSTEEAARKQRSALRMGLLRDRYKLVPPYVKSYLDGDEGLGKATVASIAKWCILCKELPLLAQLCRDSPYPAHYEFPANETVEVDGEEKLLTTYLRDEGAPHGLDICLKVSLAAASRLGPHACIVSMKLSANDYDTPDMAQLMRRLRGYTGLREFLTTSSMTRPEESTAMIEGLLDLPALESVNLRGLPAGCGKKALQGLFESVSIRDVKLDGSGACTQDIVDALCAAKPAAVAQEIHLPELSSQQMKRVLEDATQPLGSVQFLGPDDPGQHQPDLRGISCRWKDVNLSWRPRTGRALEAFTEQIFAVIRQETMDRLIFSQPVKTRIIDGFTGGWKPPGHPDAKLAGNPFKEIDAGLGRYLDPKDWAKLSMVTKKATQSVDETRSEGVQKAHDEYVEAGGSALRSQRQLHGLHHVWMLDDSENSWMREPILGPWDEVTPENFGQACENAGIFGNGKAALDLTRLGKDQAAQLLSVLKKREIVLALNAPLDLRMLQTLLARARALVQVRIGGVVFRRGKETKATVPLAQLLEKDVPEQDFRALLKEMDASFVLQEPLKVDRSNVDSTIAHLQDSGATQVSLRIGDLTTVAFQALRNGLHETASIRALDLTLDAPVTPGILDVLAQTARLERVTFSGGQMFSHEKALDDTAFALTQNLFMKEGMGRPLLRLLLKALAVPLQPAQAAWFAEKYIELGDEDGLVEFIESSPPGTIRINTEAMMLKGESIDPIGEVLKRRKVADRVVLEGAPGTVKAQNTGIGSFREDKPEAGKPAAPPIVNLTHFDASLEAARKTKATVVQVASLNFQPQHWKQLASFLHKNQHVRQVEFDDFILTRHKAPDATTRNRLRAMLHNLPRARQDLLQALEIPAKPGLTKLETSRSLNQPPVDIGTGKPPVRKGKEKEREKKSEAPVVEKDTTVRRSRIVKKSTKSPGSTVAQDKVKESAHEKKPEDKDRTRKN